MLPVETFFCGGGGFWTTFIHRRFEWRAAVEEFALLAEALAHNTGDGEINPQAHGFPLQVRCEFLVWMGLGAERHARENAAWAYRTE